MLTIKDKNGKTKWILSDDDEEPVSIDELILRDQQKQKEKENADRSSTSSD